MLSDPRGLEWLLGCLVWVQMKHYKRLYSKALKSRVSGHAIEGFPWTQDLLVATF
jgi:hypothetical protein